MIEIIKAIIFGIVEGITEWLPISSTGHLILLDEFISLDISKEFADFFLVAIQLGAIFAVVIYFVDDYWPFVKGKFEQRIQLWLKIFVACIPAGIIGILFDDIFNAIFYNYITVAIMLAVFGFIFLIVDRGDKRAGAQKTELADISYKDSIIIGLFQTIAAVFPGTSRSGATIVGGLISGLSRKTAAEFTFIMAIPVMAGASLLKMLKLSSWPTSTEWWVLVAGSASAFIVSLICIKGLMRYIKKNDFRVFAYYRIILSVVILLYFGVFRR